MYYRGLGVPQDFAEALTWYRKAADQGHAGAEFSVATMYDKGQGVPQDFKTAVTWYQKAADRGDAGAQGSLGSMYGNGQGVPKDYVRAHMWFNLAAGVGNHTALQNRDAIGRLVTPAQIEEARKPVREWKPKSE
jgi:TPR repeat protein